MNQDCGPGVALLLLYPSGGATAKGATSRTELVCQVTRVWRRTGLASIVCGARLAMVEGVWVPTGIVVADVRMALAGEVAVWCQKCKRASIYKKG